MLPSSPGPGPPPPPTATAIATTSAARWTLSKWARAAVGAMVVGAVLSVARASERAGGVGTGDADAGSGKWVEVEDAAVPALPTPTTRFRAFTEEELREERTRHAEMMARRTQAPTAASGEEESAVVERLVRSVRVVRASTNLHEPKEEEDEELPSIETKEAIQAIEASNPLQNFTVAYCVYRQKDRAYDPVGHSKWLAQWLGPHVFPNRRLVLRPCVALPSLLPVGAPEDEHLRLLGLSPDVDLRVCRFGSSQILAFLKEKLGGDVEETHVRLQDIRKRFAALGIKQQLPDEQGWSHNRTVHWPASAYVLRGASPTSRIPFILRHNHEPWFEEVRGVAAQMEGKRERLPHSSVVFYLPLVVESFAWRWALGKDGLGTRGNQAAGASVGGSLTRIEEACTRSLSFDARAALRSKEFFAASVHSHCASPRAHVPSVLLRELFAIRLHQRVGKPVHHLGYCPLDDADKYERVGVPRAAGMKLRERFRSASAIDVFRAHKFGIVFENGRVDAYVTEKIVNAYLGHAIPIYFGPFPDADLWRVLNPRAAIFCDLPRNITAVVDAFHAQSQNDFGAFRALVEERVGPFLDACADMVRKLDADDEAYVRMLKEPLAPVDPATHRLSGVWSAKTLGMGVRHAMVALGFMESDVRR